MPDTAPGSADPIVLDPTAADHHGEAARLRAAGPVVRVVLPGGVLAWMVTDHALLASLLIDPRVSKNPRNWTALHTGQVPADWPLRGMFVVENMFNADEAEHQRLRRPVAKVFTPRRVAQLRSQVEQIVTALLEALPDQAGTDGVVDLRRHLAYPVPMTVICDLLAVPEDWRPELRALVDSLFDSTTTAEDAAATQDARRELLNKLITLRRGYPGDDLTSALITVNDDDPEALSDSELVDTLWLLLTAGHETTMSLITNGARALLTHPDQLQYALAGTPEIWARVIEETLRWDAPVGNFPARYPLEDLEIGGVTIPAGEVILAAYSGVGRDPRQHGPDADRFDVTRTPDSRHLAFGGGAHVCPGAHLARLEAILALENLFTWYPHVTLVVDPAELPPVPSLFSNSVQELPVRLTRP
jgi:cytochrome P450